MTNKFERKIKLITEEKYKLANQFLFGYAFDNDLYCGTNNLEQELKRINEK